MARKYRYRFERGTSHQIDHGGSDYRAKPLDKLAKLGRLVKVEAIRYSTMQKGSDGLLYPIPHKERIRVVGENGTARFSGVCWGYGGSGPHATFALLKACGVPKEDAERYAFNTKRGHSDGVDWSIDLTAYELATV